MEPEEIVLKITERMDEGFGKMHGKIDDLRCDFNSHKPTCEGRFVALETTLKVWEIRDQTKESVLSGEKKGRIDMGRVKTGVAIAVASLLSLAAVKILFTNLDKIRW